jgi:hypothetical protein
MNRKAWRLAVAVIGTLNASLVLAQAPCTTGFRIEGVIADPTGAVIPGAQVQVSDGKRSTSDAAGHYVLSCVPVGTAVITVQAEGFDGKTVQVSGQQGRLATADVQLEIATVQDSVQVNADTVASDTDEGGSTVTLDTKEVQQLADDPDDFLRQLQSLAAAAGGDPTSAIIRVDGFQNGSVLPPKGAIASIRVASDLFSSEYSFPPFGGGQVDIFTKPGADTFHGALFFTDSDGRFNATDPLSLTATPAGKRRYGFEFSGPMIQKKSGFSLALEKRDIDEFEVISAKTLSANNAVVPLQQTLSAPQRLWIASARADWQVTTKDVGALSFSSKVNSLGNQGAGGLTLAEAGYDSLVSEYDLRLTNTYTLNANTLHETRIGYAWKRTQQTPLSTAPSVQVAGYFTGGGAISQNLNDREHDLEVDDDMLLTRGRHELKIGAQGLGLFVHDYDPNTFNGAYVFGGGSAPVLDANNKPTGVSGSITPIEQYSRALQGLPGGSPTTYQLTSGTPLVSLTQWRLALYAQDNIKLAPRLNLLAGLRYSLQTAPISLANFGPRLGIAWSADKKETWNFHLRAGLFSGPNNQAYAVEVERLNGVHQQQALVYSPSYKDPLNPVPGSIQVNTVYQFPHSLTQQGTFVAYFNVEHIFLHHTHMQANLYWGEDSNNIRIRNINAPLVPSSIGTAPDPTAALLAPRQIASGENILEYQNSGHLAGDVMSVNVEQHSYKRFGFYVYYAHLNFKSNVGYGLSVFPQSSYSDAGESSRVDWLRHNRVNVISNLNLPLKVELMAQFDASNGQPYNITTGTDNNGDGEFNDRPSYATVPGPGVYSTSFGLLTTNTVNGNVPRNLGTMPNLLHLDVNLSRAFTLNRKDKNHLRVFTFNARSANLLNHTNVEVVNTVLSSSTLGQPITTETARRLELGARFSF